MSLPSPRSYRPDLEALEDRRLPAGLSAVLSAGTLTITGTDGNDTVLIQSTAGIIGISGLATTFTQSSVSRITVNAGKGNDYVKINSGINLPVIFNGGEGNDTLIGGSANDTLNGDAGNDLLYGMDGNDNLGGDDGDDTLQGGNGNDTLNGDNGIDKLYGDGGADQLFGGAGNDYLHGGIDGYHDLMDGGDGTDTFHRYLATAYKSGGEQDYSADSSPNIVPTSPQKSSMEDVYQAYNPTCSFYSALASVARTTDLYGQIEYDAARDIYKVPLFVNGVKTKVEVNSDWTEGFHAHGELWVSLYFKAYLQVANVNTTTWTSSTGVRWNYTGFALTTLTGKFADWFYPTSGTTAANIQRIKDSLAKKQHVIAPTKSSLDRTKTNLVENHAYTVVDAGQDASGYYVILRNPWGHDNQDKTTKKFYSIDGKDDGLIRVSWDVFKANMMYYNISRL